MIKVGKCYNVPLSTTHFYLLINYSLLRFFLISAKKLKRHKPTRLNLALKTPVIKREKFACSEYCACAIYILSKLDANAMDACMKYVNDLWCFV